MKFERIGYPSAGTLGISDNIARILANSVGRHKGKHEVVVGEGRG